MSKEHIFHESILTKSQSDAVLSALKSIDPVYKPVPPPLAARTKIPDGRLLQGLKEPVKEDYVCDALPCDFKVESLDTMFEKQLENEMRGRLVHISHLGIIIFAHDLVPHNILTSHTG